MTDKLDFEGVWELFNNPDEDDVEYWSVRANELYKIQKALKIAAAVQNMVDEMEDVPPEFAKLLDENLFECLA